MIDRRAFAASAGALLLAPSARAEGAPRTFRYAQAPGVAPALQSLDLYAGPGGKAPLVVFIHGGGWRIGDKQNGAAGREKAAFFNAQGFAYASVNYRLSPDVMHPAHVQDVAAALAWLADHAVAEGADPARIFVMGHSAGAHLAALVATDARRLGAFGKSPSMLKGVILLDGAGYDVAREAAATIARGGFLGAMYADAFGADPAGWADASPVRFVTRGAPPFLIVRTDRPDAVTQTALLRDALGRAGVDVTVFRAAGYTHADVNRRIGQTGEPVTGAIMAALRRWGG